jgi:hypothetical protein
MQGLVYFPVRVDIASGVAAKRGRAEACWRRGRRRLGEGQCRGGGSAVAAGSQRGQEGHLVLHCAQLQRHSLELACELVVVCLDARQPADQRRIVALQLGVGRLQFFHVAPLLLARQLGRGTVPQRSFTSFRFTVHRVCRATTLFAFCLHHRRVSGRASRHRRQRRSGYSWRFIHRGDGAVCNFFEGVGPGN